MASDGARTLEAGPIAGVEAPLGARRQLAITLLMGLVQLLITSDFSSVSVALPAIGAALQIDPAALSWVVSATSITFVGLMIVGGRLTDLFGHRRALAWGLTAFALGSGLSALAQNLWMLIASRALLGAGAAVIAPASFALITAFLPAGRAQQRALGVFGWTQGLSVLAGLLLGGVLTSRISWRAVFCINLPFALVALALALAVLPRAGASARRGEPVDLGGGLAMMAGTALLLSAVPALGAGGAAAWRGLALLAGSAAAYGLFLRLEGGRSYALLPLSIFRTGDLTAASLALMALIGAVGALFVSASLFMQRKLGFSAELSGLGMAPVALATMAAGQCAPLFMRRLPLRTIALGGQALQAVALLLLALAAPSGRYAATIAPFASLSVFGSASAFMALMGLATGQARPEQQGTASALLFTAHQIGLPIGVALALAAFRAAVPAAHAPLEAHQASFVVATICAAAGFLLTLFLVRPSPRPLQP